MNRTGHCKFRLDCRTKRKKTTDAPLALPVHIPLDTVSVAIPLERLPLKISIPLEIVNRTVLHSFSHLLARMEWTDVLQPGWVKFPIGDSAHLLFSKLWMSADGLVEIQTNLRIMYNFSWEVRVCGKLVPRQGTCLLMRSLPAVINSVLDLDMTIKTVDASQLCVGNPDEIFKALMLKKTFFSRDGINIVAEVEELMLGYPTIRSRGCEILICIGPAKRCLQCTMHRKSLYAMISQNRAETSTERVMPTSHTNYRYMSAPDLRSRLTLLHKEHCKKTLQLERLRKKVAIYCEEDNGMEVDAETHDDLKSSVVNTSATVVGSYPPDSLE